MPHISRDATVSVDSTNSHLQLPPHTARSIFNQSTEDTPDAN